ncbi:MAG: outer membrane protein assembly factor BamB family protein [Planctomycetota bacterium]
MTLDGRLIGQTPDSPEGREVTVPVPVAGRLRCRVHLAGYEPLDLDVPWADVRWPYAVTLQKEAAWSFQMAGPPSGGSVESAGSDGGILIGSIDRHLYRLGGFGSLRRRTPLGLRSEVVGAPLSRPEAALVATLDARLRGFDADGRELVQVRLPAAPAGGPVMLGDGVGVALVTGECWLFPLDALLQTAGGADAAGVRGARAAKLEQAPAGPPVPFGREWFLLLGKEGRLAVFRTRDGLERYRRELEGRPAGAPAVADDGICFIAMAGGRVEARVVLTGQPRWPQPARVTGGAGTGPVVAGDYLLVGSAKDGVYAFDRKSGVREGRYLTGAGVVARPAVSNDVVYVGDLAGKVSAFGLKPGAGRRWARSLGAPIQADLRAAAGAVIAITEEGRVIALRE